MDGDEARLAPTGLVLTIAAIVLAFTVLPSPWGVVAVVGAAIVDTVETVALVVWSKRRRATVGAETFVGRSATVVTAVAPRGQVKLDGEVWDARSTTVLVPGDEVVVTAVDGLVLDVEPRK